MQSIVISLCVCLSVCPPANLINRATKFPIFSLLVICGRGSVTEYIGGARYTFFGSVL